MDSDTNTSKPFPFELLPLELRNEIYKHLLVSEEAIRFSDPPIGIQRQAQILRISSKVHHEAAAILYGHNKFEFYSPSNLPPVGRSYWISKVYLKFLTDVTLHGVWFYELHRAKRLRKLTLKITKMTYDMLKALPTVSILMRDTPGIKELLQIRGLETLEIVDVKHAHQDWSGLENVQKRLANLLRSELLKPRRFH